MWRTCKVIARPVTLEMDDRFDWERGWITHNASVDRKTGVRALSR